MKKFFQFFLSAYSNDHLELQKKTRMLLLVNSLVSALLLLNALFSELLIAHDPVNAVVEAVLAVILALGLFLLKKKYFLLASNVSVILLSIAFFFLSVITKDVSAGFILLKISFLQAPVILYSSLIGIRSFQTVLTASMSIGFLSVYYLTLPLFVANYNFQQKEVYHFIVCILVLFVAGVLSYLILKNNRELIDIAEKETESSLDKNKRIGEVVQSSKEGMSIGEKLEEFASRTLELVTGINRNFEQTRKETDFLSAIIRNSMDSNTAMLDSSKKVKTIIEEQNAAVNETSSSVEEITRSMSLISSSASARKEIIDRLVQTAQESRTEMEQAVVSIREISRSADDMLHFIKIIQDVASQTNVLAMNAAIEASHAGASGKGFAIVAQEIRKLSVETDRNSKLISSTLKKNIGDIGKAAAINVRAGEYFQKMSTEVAEVKNVMDEIIIGMQEVSKGTGSILEAVTDILKMSGEVGQSMNEVDTRITDSNGNIQNISRFTAELKVKIESMVKNYEDIVHITRLIDQAGKENTKYMEKLDQEISSIMK